MKDEILGILKELENVDKVTAVVFSGKKELIVSEKSAKKLEGGTAIIVLVKRVAAMLKYAIIEEPESVNVFSKKRKWR